MCADVSENKLPETKNNFSGMDISWPTPSVSSSAPSCSLDIICYMYTKILLELARSSSPGN